MVTVRADVSTGAPAAAVESAAAAFNRGDVEGYLSHVTLDCRRWIVGFDDPLDIVRQLTTPGGAGS